MLHRTCLRKENLSFYPFVCLFVWGVFFGSESKLVCWNSAVCVSRATNREISLQEVMRFLLGFSAQGGHHSCNFITVYFLIFSSDLWALGCIIYQLVAGLPPFRAG